MSKTAKDLANAIKALTASSSCELATVVSVDKTNNTCEVSLDGDELGQVRLQSITETGLKGCRLYPAVGSKVVIEELNSGGDWMVILMSEIEEVMYEVNNMSMKISDSGILFNGGSLGGMVKLAGAVDRWNKIEQDLNSLKTVFTSWITVPNDGGAALKAAAATWAGKQLAATANSDVENTKIKQ